MDILLEASNAQQVIKEIQVHWKTHLIIKNWSVMSTTNPEERLELQVYMNELPYTRKAEKPTIQSIKQKFGQQITSDKYVLF